MVVSKQLGKKCYKSHKRSLLLYETSISAEARMCANRTTKPGKADRKINKMMVWFQRQKDSKSREMELHNASMPLCL